MNTDELRREINFHHDGILRELERLKPTLLKFANDPFWEQPHNISKTARLLREVKDRLMEI